jgi:hypothetical protein
MSGRITQILGAHFGITQNGELVCPEIISTFLPPRVRERFLDSYVLDCFQSSSKDLSSYLVLVVAAADILGLKGQESQSIRHCKISIRKLRRTSFFQVSRSLCET